MEELSRRSAQEVLEDHLTIAQRWESEDLEQIVEEDLRRNVSENIVVLINRGVFRGHAGGRCGRARRLQRSGSKACPRVPIKTCGTRSPPPSPPATTSAVAVTRSATSLSPRR